MDEKLKDLLQRAEAWPEAAQDELVEAAAKIEKRLGGQPPTPSAKTDDVRRTQRADDTPRAQTVLEALLRAPKVEHSIAPRRGLRVRIRPPVKF